MDHGIELARGELIEQLMRVLFVGSHDVSPHRTILARKCPSLVKE